MKKLQYTIAGMCIVTGIFCVIAGSPIIGGINLLLAVINLTAVNDYE